MSAFAGPEIVNDGLMLALDAGNSKSYPGNGTSIIDLSNTNNNGSLRNGTTYDSNNGGSLVFSSVAKHDVAFSNSSSLSITGPITLSAWIYYTSWNNYPGIITKGYGTSGGYSLHIRQDYSLWFEIDETNSTRHFYNPTTVKTGLDAWYNTVAVYDGSLMQIYINGVPAGAGLAKSVTIGVNSLDVTVANSQYGGGTHVDGRIPIASIYNRALSAAEIQQNFNALRGRFNV